MLYWPDSTPWTLWSWSQTAPGRAAAGDLDLAEGAGQEAMDAALRTWPEQGVLRSWLARRTTVATRSALDRVRRVATAARRLARLGA